MHAWLYKAKQWAASEPLIDALLVVGSHARGAQTPSSDLDLVVVTRDVQHYIERPQTLAFGHKIQKHQLEHYGACTSLRVWYADGPEIEFGFVSPDWLSLPLDAGTEAVLQAGYLILLDKAGCLHEVAQQIKPFNFVRR